MIENLVNWKSISKSKTPYIKLQFLALKQNEHQIESLKVESRKLNVDELIIKTAQIYDFENARLILVYIFYFEISISAGQRNRIVGFY